MIAVMVYGREEYFAAVNMVADAGTRQLQDISRMRSGMSFVKTATGSEAEKATGSDVEKATDSEAKQEISTDSNAEIPIFNDLANPPLELLKEYAEGKVTIDNIEYWCYSNGEASIRNGKRATGNIVIPREIIGIGDETYLVTAIEGYTESGREKGAFQGSAITGLSFEDDSELRSIAPSAFSACYGLTGASVTIPDSVTEIGDEAFYMFYEDEGLAELRHKHVAYVEGTLPDLEPDTILEVPGAAKQYESMVDSSEDDTILHKASKWTNDDLTEAEIRIDYGESQSKSGALDFVFVIDYSNSMLKPAAAADREGNNYMYPRSLLTNDVVYGISDIILDNAPTGYDNRIAMVTFGSDTFPLWQSDFMNSSAMVEATLFENPLTLTNGTNYSVGLRGAIDIIENREDKSRRAAVIFLSDGEPNSGYGKEEAKILRNMGVKVYPVAIYADVNTYLTGISYDGKTAYNAKDSEAFEDIMMEVVEDIVQEEEPLNLVLEDVLAEPFVMATGTTADVAISTDGGSVMINDRTLAWDLTGSSPGIVHNIRIKVKLQAGTERTATGILPTNQAMGAVDNSIVSDSQPELIRYLVHHEFQNGSYPGQPLPDAVTALLPGHAGGFRNGAEVSASQLLAAEVVLDNGDRWEFVEWTPGQAVIAGEDMTFTGKWILVSRPAYQLPATGGSGTRSGMVAGIILLFAAMGLGRIIK